jgi:NAD(P)-dependent dehydrogenase (short-subunit alcohol dehydrogenase family)
VPTQGCDLKVEGAAETVELVRAAGGQMDSNQPLDLTDEEAVRRWIDGAAQRHGAIDVLYNNAGLPASTRSTKSPTKTGSSLFATNWTSCFSPPSTPGRT